MYKTFGLLLVIFLIGANSKLSVYSPQTLKDEYSGAPINYSIANFGHIPYGKTLVGSVYIADPEMACTPLNASFSSESKEAPFLLVKRGECTFVTKVRYAQLIGAKLVIIYDDRDEKSEDITMKDDGFAYNMKIPSIFIEKKDGEKLKSYINNSDVDKRAVSLTIKFDTITVNRVNYTFWISTSNRNSFKLIRDFKPYLDKIKADSVFSPHYAIWTCPYCAQKNFTLPYENCLSGGRYCSPDPDGDGPGKGKNVIEEDLRQICIYQEYPDLWWDYMIRFDEKCIESQLYEICSTAEMKNLGIDTGKISTCIDKSFESSGIRPNPEIDDNKVLRNERNIFLKYGVHFWPSVHINNDSYRGSLDAEDVFDAICSAFEVAPPGCENALGISRASDGPNVTLIVIIVISVLVVFFFFMVFIYKKMVKREMQSEISTQVNQMVSQYIAFYESRDNKPAGTTENL